MNCQKFETVVSELARNQIMEADLRAEALKHTDDCVECAGRMRDQQFLSESFAELCSAMSSLQASPQLELKLREAFQQSNQSTPFSVKRRSNRRNWLTAVAAVFLVVIGLATVRLLPGTSDRQIAVIPAQPVPVDERPSLVQRPSQTPVVRVLKEEYPTRPHRRSAGAFYATNSQKRNEQNPQADNHATQEVATEFMPLGYMNAANLQDGGQIVRVELPRSALANFGIPVNMDRYNERVKADVLFGVDGLAHAIRFVQ
jgi:hypothetical protein